jgi:CBS domain-containing protein
MNVSQILNQKGRSVVTERSDTSIAGVVSVLAAKRIGALLVTNPDGQLAGIVSERDVMWAIASEGPECLEHPVSSIMTRDVITCTPSSSLNEVMEMMTVGRFRHVPVMEGGRLAGIVSIGDVVKRHIAEVEMEASALKSYVAG